MTQNELSTYANGEEWQQGRDAIEEWAARLEANPTSCAHYETVLTEMSGDARLYYLDIFQFAMRSLNLVHVTHDDPTKHDYTVIDLNVAH